MRTLTAPLSVALLSAAATVIMASYARAADDNAPPFVAPLFTDNMVLQRGIADPVWGWTTPGAKVTVRIAGKTATATADKDGKWLTKVGPLPVGGPYELSIAGPQQVTLKNILVGDVWICSGQSNMEMGISGVSNAEAEIASANYPQIRLYTVPKKVATRPQTGIVRRDSDLMGQWSVCTPQTVRTGGWGGFSATGYFFGRTLQENLKVPIGLIHTSWGGTIIEAWTGAESLNKIPQFRPAVAQIQGVDPDQAAADYARQMTTWYAQNDSGTANNAAWASPTQDTSSWKTAAQPAAWEGAGLPEFDGVVWYRKTIDLTAEQAGSEAILHLGPIDDRDVTWVNGRQVGSTDDYAADRRYRLPAGSLKPGKNVITLRVLDTGGAGGLYGKPEQLALETPGGQSLLSLAGDWQYQTGVSLAKATTLPVLVNGNNPNLVTVLYNGMISPVLPYGIKGAIWYQGESNAGQAYMYRTLLPTMIQDWRSRWGVGDFPFYIVQLASFMQSPAQPVEDAWAELREAQLLTTQRVKNTGLAVAIDIGEANDIHPHNKQDVGKRLALAALGTTYGQKIEYSGPAYQSRKIEDTKIRLRFTHVGGGLVAKGGKLTGFAIAGADRKWVWADAVIDGDTVVVSSPQVPTPVAVRYAWSANPVCNLYNQAGLPASPFRTDDWPGITVPTK